MLLRDGRLPGQDDAVDILIRDGKVAEIRPSDSIAAASADEIVDLDGLVVTPGLWDEHVHFTQLAVQRTRFDLSGTGSAAEVIDLVGRQLAEHPPQGGRMVSGYGFRDGGWPDAPSLAALDSVTAGAAVLLVSADLHCAWMNSSAAARFGVEPDAFGLVREGPWLDALRDSPEQNEVDTATYARVAADAAARGVVGVVDFESADNIRDWPLRVAAGVDSLRVEASVWPDRLDKAIANGHRTGEILDSRGLVTMGFLKVIVDGSLNTRTALCWDPYPGTDASKSASFGVESFAQPVYLELMRRAHEHGIAPAIHAIGDRANTDVLDVFQELGIRGRVEHAQLVQLADFPRFAELGVIASVQPEQAMDDRDVADKFWAGRTNRAFALSSLHRAGAVLRFGSDAPVAPLDPWVAISAAVSRSRDGREPWHPDERIPLDVALASSARGRSDIAVGDVADVALLGADPYSIETDALRTMPVAGTLLGGRWTHRAF